MIAKRIIRKSGRGTKQLLAYVVNEEGKGRGGPTAWKLAEYVLDTAHAGEKVAQPTAGFSFRGGRPIGRADDVSSPSTAYAAT
jgi:hypothetical protein